MFVTPRVATATIAAAILIAACSNPVEVEHHDEDVQVYGLLLVSEMKEIVRVEGGTTGDTLYVAAGDTTSVIEVEFIDEHGDEIHRGDLPEEYSLAWTIERGDGFRIEALGRWSFALIGQTPGTGAISLQLFHGDHDDFTTPDIPVIVR